MGKNTSLLTSTWHPYIGGILYGKKYEKEEMLTGGNVSNVYRSGHTVRRELKPGSTNIHKLLKHLEKKGFGFAPKF